MSLVGTAFGDAPPTERAFAAADHVVEMEFHIGRVTGVPIEPRAALGHWDAETGRLYPVGRQRRGGSAKVPSWQAVLGVAPERVRVAVFRCRRQFRHDATGSM